MSASSSIIFQEPSKSEPAPSQSAVIKVFGVGGGGCNALAQMIAADIRGVEFKCVNTDLQALAKFDPNDVIELGSTLTRGLGAGADPEVGRKAAQESNDIIAEAIGNADMLFLTAGMGGGTGTGAISVVSKIAREMGVLTVAVVTEPFAFEGERRKRIAEEGLKELCENADSMIVVPNENLLTSLGPDITLVEAFAAANDIVTNAVQSIAELITTTGLINVDFADVKSVMTEMGHAIMSTGNGMGENRAYDAAISAIESPLLNNIDLKEARGILANISSSSDLSMGEFQTVGDIIRSIAAENANVVIGTVLDEDLTFEMKVTVVATGLNPPKPVELKEATIVRRAASNVKKQATSATSAVPPHVAASEALPNQSSIAIEEAMTNVPEPVSNSVRKLTVEEPAFERPEIQAIATTQEAVNDAVHVPPDTVEVRSSKAEDTCILCGGRDDVHETACPINKNPVKAEKKSAVSNKKKKSSFAGLAFGVLALLAILYFAMTQWAFTKDKTNAIQSSVPESPPASNTRQQDTMLLNRKKPKNPNGGVN